jgi:aminoglycoside phosphotransferase
LTHFALSEFAKWNSACYVRDMAVARPLANDAPPSAAASRARGEELEPVRPLKGHSGAEILLCVRGRSSVVRKTAGSVTQNTRLQQQIAKQRLLAAHGLSFPRVISEGIDDRGLAYAEMEYVPARTVASIVANAAPFDQEPVLKAIERALTLFRLQAGDALGADIFQRKISDIVAKSTTRAADGLLADKIAGIGRELSSRNWNAIPSSPCHGDMTLENILLQQKRAVFIDCDETFASSYWLDLSKLYQDVDGHWFLRKLYLEPPTKTALANAVGRLLRLAAPLRALALRLEPGFDAYRPHLTALNLFRTIPYTNDRKQIEFVLDRMRMVLAHE